MRFSEAKGLNRCTLGKMRSSVSLSAWKRVQERGYAGQTAATSKFSSHARAVINDDRPKIFLSFVAKPFTFLRRSLIFYFPAIHVTLF